MHEPKSGVAVGPPWQRCDSYADLADAVARIARKVAGAEASQVDEHARFPQNALDALRKVGALGAGVPTRLGGLGCSTTQLAQLCRTLGEHCASSAMILAMHYIQVAAITHHCQENLDWQDYLHQLCREQKLIASVTSEVGTDGNMMQSVAALELNKERFVFEKQATTISYGEYADDLLVTLKSNKESAATDQVLVLACAGDFELKTNSEWDTLGMRGTCSPGARVFAQGKPWQVLPESFASISAHTMVPVSHILWSAVWLGIATDAVTKVRGLLIKQYRKDTESIPAKAKQLAALDGKLQLMIAEQQAVLQEYEELLASGRRIDVFNVRFALKINGLKIHASELVKEIVLDAIQIAGIAAYRNNSDTSLGRQMRDALSASLMISNERLVEYNATLQMLHRGR